MDTEEKIAIVVDSCGDVPEEFVKNYPIFVLPMVITTSEGEYLDGVDIHAEDIYAIQKKEMPKTGCPTGAAVMDTFEKIRREGYRKVLVILLSSGLSGTYNHVCMLAKEAEDLEISVYDSLKGSIGIGAIAMQAALYIEQGMSFEMLKEKVEALIYDTKVFFSIDTLDYLKKGGRIGKVTAMAGALLNIKPILSFDEQDGEIYAAAKVRGKNQVAGRLLSLVGTFERERRQYNLLVADGGAPQEREELEARLKELFPDYVHIFRAEIGAALSVYLGDGLLGAGIQFFD